VAILETALTLPVILYIVFFSIELIRIGLAQAAVDAITKEFTFYLMANGKIVKSEVDAIFEKYRPLGIPIGYFKYNVRLYPYMTSPDGGTTKGIMDVSPYGGESIYWPDTDYTNPDPNKSPTSAASTQSYGRAPSRATFSKYQGGYTGDVDHGEVATTKRKQLLESQVPSGYIFVLTISVKFPFSSPFVAKLFNGGSNTDQDGVYILWARGSGMIN